MIRIFRVLMKYIVKMIHYGDNFEAPPINAAISNKVIFHWYIGIISFLIGTMLFFILQSMIYLYYWFLFLIFRYYIDETDFTDEKENWCRDNKLWYYAFFKQFTIDGENLLALTTASINHEQVKFSTKNGAIAYKLRWIE